MRGEIIRNIIDLFGLVIPSAIPLTCVLNLSDQEAGK